MSVGESGLPGDVGADEIAEDAIVRCGREQDIDAHKGVSGNNVARRSGSATHQVIRCAVNPDAILAIAQLRVPGRVSSDQISLYAVVLRGCALDLDSAVAVPG